MRLSDMATVPTRSRITTRENEVLYYLSQGYTSKQTAYVMHISPLTVDKHKKNLMDKFGANSSAHLVYLCMSQDLL